MKYGDGKDADAYYYREQRRGERNYYKQRPAPPPLSPSYDERDRWHDSSHRQHPRQRSFFDSPSSRPEYHRTDRHRRHYSDISPVARPTRINLDDDDIWMMPSNLGQRHDRERRGFDAEYRPDVATSYHQRSRAAHQREPSLSPQWHTRSRSSSDFSLNQRPHQVHRKSSWSSTSASPSQSHNESDAASVFANIRTESDSYSSDNADNFDSDENDVEDEPPPPIKPPVSKRDDPAHSRRGHRKSTPKKRQPRSRRPIESTPATNVIDTKPAKKKKEKQPSVVKAQPPASPLSAIETILGSGSSFTMGSSQASVEIVAIAPPGAQVDASDAAAIGALLWTADFVDRLGLVVAIVLAVIVLASCVGAIINHEPSLYVVVGVYLVLGVLLHWETRILQDQVRDVHDRHATMTATQLAMVGVAAAARRAIKTMADRLQKLVQVTAGASGIFMTILAGLSTWTKGWVTLALALVVLVVSAAAGFSAVVFHRNIVDNTDRMMSSDPNDEDYIGDIT